MFFNGLWGAGVPRLGSGVSGCSTLVSTPLYNFVWDEGDEDWIPELGCTFYVQAHGRPKLRRILNDY
jgi:hypothetical protein